MDILELLENRVVDLIGQIGTLREQKKNLEEQVATLSEESADLKAKLAQELQLKEEVNGRINTVLSTIHEFTGEA